MATEASSADLVRTMKTAIYIEDGVTQVVLTPETDWEKQAISTLEKQNFSCQLFAGQFYDCRGGWTRQGDYYPHYSYGHDAHRDYSLMIRIEKPPTKHQYVDCPHGTGCPDCLGAAPIV